MNVLKSQFLIERHCFWHASMFGCVFRGLDQSDSSGLIHGGEPTITFSLYSTMRSLSDATAPSKRLPPSSVSMPVVAAASKVSEGKRKLCIISKAKRPAPEQTLLV
jgi:hypothetical protein